METTQADRPVTTCDDNPAVVRPACCAECLRFYRDKDNPGKGWCEEFPAAGLLDENVVCRPNFGRKIARSAFARVARKTKPGKNGRKEGQDVL